MEANFKVKEFCVKKIVCVLVLACVIMGGAFAQQKPAAPKAPAAPAKPAAAPAASAKQNAAALDVFPLLGGIIASNDDVLFINFSAAYERLIVPHISIGGDLDFYFIHFDSADKNGIYFSLAAEGRYYPAADFDKFFLGTTLGFNVLSLDGKTKPENGGFVGLITSLKMGYKLVPSKNFYMEPSLSYVLSKQSIAGLPTPLGWQGGLRVGAAF